MDQAVLMEEILVAIRRILRATEVSSKRLSKKVGLTLPQLLILQKLANTTDQKATASFLAKELSLSQATITSIVDRMVKRELVQRIRSTVDRRQIHIHLTTSGQQLLETAPTALQDNFTQELEKLEDWQQSMILSALQQVASMMNAENLDASPVLEVGPLDRTKGLP